MTHQHTKQVHQINILHVNWMWVQCVHRLSHYAVTPNDDAIHWRSCRWTIAVYIVSAMPRQSFVSVRQWDETLTMIDHLLKGTPDGIINRVQIRAIRWPYAGAVLRCGQGGPGPPVCGWAPDFWRFPVFITNIVFVMTWRGPVARPPRILGLERAWSYVWLTELHILTLPETRCVTTAIIR